MVQQLLHNCEWLKQNETSEADNYRKEYEEIINEINQFIIDKYKEWNEKLPAHFSSRLKQPLMGKCFYRPGLIEVNIDRFEFPYYKLRTHRYWNMSFQITATSL